jgi:hypothetical protein
MPASCSIVFVCTFHMAEFLGVALYLAAASTRFWARESVPAVRD